MLFETAPAAGLEAATWELIRATGLLAYLLLTLSVALGLSVNVRALDSITRRAHVYEGHQSISIAALAITVLHVATLLVHRYITFTPAEVFVPFTSDWKPVPVALGIVALYLTGLLTASSYTRNSIGQRTWRLIHFSSFIAWVAAVLHGIFAGSDTALPLVQYLYLATVSPVALLLCFRIIAPSAHPERRLVILTARDAPSSPPGAEAAAPPSPSAR